MLSFSPPVCDLEGFPFPGRAADLDRRRPARFRRRRRSRVRSFGWSDAGDEGGSETPLRNIDFTSWQGLLLSLLGLALVTLIGVGIRLLAMFTIQQRRERLNRQINERLRTLIAAYKVLGGSFTGNLAVDPRHLGDLMRPNDAAMDIDPGADPDPRAEATKGSDRGRRIRDAVEASLADIILLGTEEHVRLAERAARELVAGRPVHTHELVVSLRDFIRTALDLDPIPLDLSLPPQGPTRPSASGGRSKGGERGKDDLERKSGGGGAAAGGSGGGGGGSMGFSSGDVDEEATPSDRRR